MVAENDMLTDSAAFREALKLFVWTEDEDVEQPAIVETNRSFDNKHAKPARRKPKRNAEDYYSGLPSESTKPLTDDVDLGDAEHTLDIKRLNRRKRKFIALADFPIVPSPQTIKRVQSDNSDSSDSADSEMESVASEAFKQNMKKAKDQVTKLGHTRSETKKNKRAPPAKITYARCRTHHSTRELYEPGETFFDKPVSELEFGPFLEEEKADEVTQKKPAKRARRDKSKVPD